MRSTRVGRILVLVALAAWLGTGCVVHHHHHASADTELEPAPPKHTHRGPPDHAPAHGHRRKHHRDDVELVFDSEAGVYVVVGRSAVYWDGVRYIRWGERGWTASARIDGVWITVSQREVPEHLRERHTAKHHKAKAKGKKRGHPRSHPAKHGY